MPQSIQRFPAGLLDLLGIQSLGQTPNILADEVRPVIEYLSLYFADRLTTLQTSVAGVQFSGDSATLTVPANELWLVKEVSGEIGGFSANGALAQCRIAFRNDSSGVALPITLAESQFKTGNVGEFAPVGVHFPDLRLFLPGNQISCQLTRHLGGVITGLVSVIVQAAVLDR